MLREAAKHRGRDGLRSLAALATLLLVGFLLVKSWNKVGTAASTPLKSGVWDPKRLQGGDDTGLQAVSSPVGHGFIDEYDSAAAHFVASGTEETILKARIQELRAERMRLSTEVIDLQTRLKKAIKARVEEERKIRAENAAAAALAASEPEVEFPLCDDLVVEGQRIPRHIMLVWENETLFPAALAVDEEWRRREPCFARRVVTDSECRELANEYPGMQPHFDNFPMNVMRADTCRLLAVYAYGGIFMDLDVKWVRPLSGWMPLNESFVFGSETEDKRHYCNWIFGAERSHPCLKAVLDLIIAKFDDATWELVKTNQHFVHDITGPAVFTEGIRKCGFQPILTRDQVRTDGVLHLYGSQAWKAAKGYNSWMDWRSELFVWHQLLVDDTETPAYAAYVLLDENATWKAYVPSLSGDVYRNPRADAISVSVRLPTAGPCDHGNRNDFALGRSPACYQRSHLLFDGYFGTFTVVQALASGGTRSAATIEVALGDGVGVPMASVQCVMVFASKFGDEQAINHARVIWKSTAGIQLAATQVLHSKRPTHDPVLRYSMWSSPGVEVEVLKKRLQESVSSILIERDDGRNMDVAEILLFGDAQCSGTPASLIFKDPPEASPKMVSDGSTGTSMPIHSVTAFVEAISSSKHVCRDVRPLGRLGDDANVWGVCFDPPLKISNRSYIDVDSISGGYHFKSKRVELQADGRKKVVEAPVAISESQQHELLKWERVHRSLPCNILSLAHTHYHSLQAAFLHMGCEVLHVDALEEVDFRRVTRGKLQFDVFGRRVLPASRKGEEAGRGSTSSTGHDWPEWQRTTTIEELMRYKNWTHIDVLILDYDAMDTHFFEEIIQMASEGSVDQLLWELQLPQMEIDTSMLSAMLNKPLEQLRGVFHQFYNHCKGQHSPSVTSVVVGPGRKISLAQKHKLSFVRKGLLREE